MNKKQRSVAKEKPVPQTIANSQYMILLSKAVNTIFKENKSDTGLIIRNLEQSKKQ